MTRSSAEQGLYYLKFTIEAIAKGMVTEGTVHLELFDACDAHLYLILSAGISDDFPVVDSAGETDIASDAPKNIVLFLEEDLCIPIASDDSTAKSCGGVPAQVPLSDLARTASNLVS